MRTLIATKYVTLDGVMEALGGEHSLGPPESPTGKGSYAISMSLDGCIAGANVRPEAGWESGGAMIVGRTTLVNSRGDKVR
jgi:hypothetical protein